MQRIATLAKILWSGLSLLVLAFTLCLFNTYWVRFDYGETSFARAVEQSKILIQAAKKAGVRRIVHLSVSNPSEDSPFPYFSGKALVERTLAEAGLSHAIIRPTLVFGGEEEILVNNIAWLLRRFLSSRSRKEPPTVCSQSM